MTTEKRLIDANELVYLVLNHPKPYRRDFYKMLNNAPTVDAVEVKHGRWIGGYNGTSYSVPKCSRCGYGNAAVGAANYCPNCGAKMDGDGNV